MRTFFAQSICSAAEKTPDIFTENREALLKDATRGSMLNETNITIY